MRSFILCIFAFLGLAASGFLFLLAGCIANGMLPIAEFSEPVFASLDHRQFTFIIFVMTGLSALGISLVFISSAFRQRLAEID